MAHKTCLPLCLHGPPLHADRILWCWVISRETKLCAWMWIISLWHGYNLGFIFLSYWLYLQFLRSTRLLLTHHKTYLQHLFTCQVDSILVFYVEITNIQWYFNHLCFTCNVSFEALLIQYRNVLGDSVVGMNPDRTYPSWYKNVISLWILFGMAWLALVIKFCINILESSSDFCQCNKKNMETAEDSMDGNKNSVTGLQNTEICSNKDTKMKRPVESPSYTAPTEAL